MVGERLFVLFAGVLLAGCRAETNASGQPPPVFEVEQGAARPVGYKDHREAEALRGLLYTEGGVVVDARAAAELISGRGAAAAAEELERAGQLFARNARLESIAAYTRAVLLDPERAEAYAGLGDALLIERMDARALAAFKTAVALAPESADMHFRLHWAHDRVGDRAETIAELEQVVALDAAYPGAWSRLAIQRYYEGDYEAAWEAVGASEEAGYAVPPQFRTLLEKEGQR